VNGLELLQACGDETVARARTVMKRQVDHLVRLVDDLLDMARVTRGKIELRRQVVRIGDAMSQAVALASPLIREREHDLRVVDEHMDLRVEGDELRLTQTIANLLNNAARYTDAGGLITLSVRPSDGGILVEVVDTGRGMPPELVPHVFDLFVQEKAGGGGLGIGLTLVKRLVHLHGGRVEASSDGVGRGSVFRVWLPQIEATLAESPEDAPAAEVARPMSVTLVEDNEDARLMMCEMLTRWGHDVRQATDGEQGVKMILAEPPDIAFIDIGLPDTDGYDVARRVRAELGPSRPHLVALSGFGQRRDRERATSVGFDHHLTKPTSVEVLQRLLLDTSRRLEQGQREQGPAEQGQREQGQIKPCPLGERAQISEK
jgi:CheY-like chemotaxis protein/anti-sigma regulatory factor (Ser/Thr protein kinase)